MSTAKQHTYNTRSTSGPLAPPTQGGPISPATSPNSTPGRGRKSQKRESPGAPPGNATISSHKSPRSKSKTRGRSRSAARRSPAARALAPAEPSSNLGAEKDTGEIPPWVLLVWMTQIAGFFTVIRQNQNQPPVVIQSVHFERNEPAPAPATPEERLTAAGRVGRVVSDSSALCKEPFIGWLFGLVVGVFQSRRPRTL